MIMREDIFVFSWIIQDEFNAYESFGRAHLVSWIIASVGLFLLGLWIILRAVEVLSEIPQRTYSTCRPLVWRSKGLI